MAANISVSVSTDVLNWLTAQAKKRNLKSGDRYSEGKAASALLTELYERERGKKE